MKYRYTKYTGDPLEDQYQETIVWADLQVRGAP